MEDYNANYFINVYQLINGKYEQLERKHFVHNVDTLDNLPKKGNGETYTIKFTTVLSNSRSRDSFYRIESEMSELLVIHYEKCDAETPYEIRTREDIETKLKLNLKGHYIQMADINLQEGREGNEQFFFPIGEGGDDYDRPGPLFQGVYNGNNYKITGLKIREEEDKKYLYGIGFFGGTKGAEILNVKLEIDTIESYNYHKPTGGLVGEMHSSSRIFNSHILSIANHIKGRRYIGGLVGATWHYLNDNAPAIIEDSSISLDNNAIRCLDNNCTMGGLVGNNDSKAIIKNSFANLNLEINNSNFGGLVGDNDGTIENSHFKGIIELKNSEGHHNIGGLVGHNYGGIYSSYCEGKIIILSEVNDSSYIGGLVGHTVGIRGVKNSYSHCDIKATSKTEDIRVGGLVGSDGRHGVINSYSTGLIDVTFDNDVTINDDDTNIGGLVSPYNILYDSSVVENSFWDIDTSGLRRSVGGGRQKNP